MSHAIPSKDEMYKAYKKAETTAKSELDTAARIPVGGAHAAQNAANAKKCLAGCFYWLHQAEKNRTDIWRYYPNADLGHQNAVTWINDNIAQPAHKLLKEFNITYDPEWINGKNMQ